MIVIHYPTAFKALNRFIDRFNDRAEKTKHRLRAGTVLTAKELIRIYGIALLKAGGVDNISKDKLPGLHTNNQQLARLVKCSSRSIQRHIARLQAAGIIVRKTFRGSNASYELFINPDILLIREKLTVENTRQELNKSLEKIHRNEVAARNTEYRTTICPHTYSGNTGNKKNNVVIAVENSKGLCDVVAGNTAGNAGEIVQETSATNEFEKKIEEAGEIVSRAAPSGHRNVRPDAARDNSLTLYSSLLWMMAHNLLYRDVDLTERQVNVAKRLIHLMYAPVPTEQLSKVHQQYVARIALVDRYIRKDPGKRYVTLPYLYFDMNNPNGFAGTKKWFQEDQMHKAEVQRELLVSRLIRQYHNNERLDLSKQKPRLQLFREYENTIGKLNEPALLQRFHAAVINGETYRHMTGTQLKLNIS